MRAFAIGVSVTTGVTAAVFGFICTNMLVAWSTA